MSVFSSVLLPMPFAPHIHSLVSPRISKLIGGSNGLSYPTTSLSTFSISRVLSISHGKEKWLSRLTTGFCMTSMRSSIFLRLFAMPAVDARALLRFI